MHEPCKDHDNAAANVTDVKHRKPLRHLDVPHGVDVVRVIPVPEDDDRTVGIGRALSEEFTHLFLGHVHGYLDAQRMRPFRVRHPGEPLTPAIPGESERRRLVFVGGVPFVLGRAEFHVLREFRVALFAFGPVILSVGVWRVGELVGGHGYDVGEVFAGDRAGAYSAGVDVGVFVAGGPSLGCVAVRPVCDDWLYHVAVPPYL